MNVCEACGQPLPRLTGDHRITDRELEILSAWWLLHSVRAVARFFGLSEQTVKNHLMNARNRNGVHSTAALAQLHMAELSTMATLHNRRDAEARRAA